MKDKESPFNMAIEPSVISRAKNGDLSAHEVLFNSFSVAVFNLAYRLTSQREMAEDVLQNTFIKVLDGVESFQSQAPFGMWLRKIAINESLMLLRKNKRLDDHHHLNSGDEIYNIAEFINLENLDRAGIHQYQVESTLEKTLAKLPSATRIVIWLKEVEGYSHQEISVMMGKTESYSKSLLSRAFKTLRECFSTELENTSKKEVL
ncbi:MAG: RNA polymerase sigma factor [Kangiellaceae bacterium]|nr:RNA polymerase sigma factor [Kangiellaceae bacterium]